MPKKNLDPAWNGIGSQRRDVCVTLDQVTTEASMIDDSPSFEGDEQFWRRQMILDAADEKADPALYPRLFTLSSAPSFTAALRTENPEPPEYVTIPLPSSMRTEEDAQLPVAVTKWNIQWEAAQYRRRLFSQEELPPPLYELADRGDLNIVLLPRTESRYFEHAPLFHLLPKAVVERHGLPLLHSGHWPFIVDNCRPDLTLPPDFDQRLGRAWASVVWRHIFHHKSPMRGFSSKDPIRLLAHNLDFWIPAVTHVIQEELREMPEVDNGIVAHPVRLQDGTPIPAVMANPRKGGDVWTGEEDAEWMVERTIEAADRHGRLREILDAVRSNRVEEDFSDWWTGEREDFERKLYHKRAKVRVRFVELSDNIPVQGPETQVVDRIVFGDLLALVNERDREVLVLLSSGITNLTEISRIMGYSNHSAVSKRLDRIAHKARKLFDIDQDRP